MLEVVLMLQEKRALISPHHHRPKEVKRLSFPPNEFEIHHTSISDEKIVNRHSHFRKKKQSYHWWII